MFHLEKCYIKPKLTQISKWRWIFWLQITTICSFWKWLFMPSSVSAHTHTQIYTLLINTHTFTHSFYWWIHELEKMHINRAVILFLQLLFNKCISKKLDVLWIYSMYLYSFILITLWRFAAVEEIHFKILTYKLLECDDKHFIFMTNMIWKKLYSIFTHIFMVEKMKRRGPHILLCIQLCISIATLRENDYRSQLEPKRPTPTTDIIFTRKPVNIGRHYVFPVLRVNCV